MLARVIVCDRDARLRTGNGREPDRKSAIEKRIGAESHDQIALRFTLINHRWFRFSSERRAVRVGRLWLPDLLGTFTAYRIDYGHVLVGFAMSWIDFAVSVDQRIGIVRRRKSIENGWVGRPTIKK
jgi:hypothetical protein